MTRKIAIVGEAWGEHEERACAPFVGPAGYELTKMLDEAGIHRADCFLTNVFNLRPAGNDVETLFTDKSGDTSGLPPLRSGKYIRAEFLPHLERLFGELRSEEPNVTIALGNTASWALLRSGAISKIRGTVAASHIRIVGRANRESSKGDYLKVIPTYHPAAVLRQWDLRHVTVLDLMKARRESEYPEIRLPRRKVYIAETIEDMEWFDANFITGARILSTDIETAGDQITCIGFAPSITEALVIPFVDYRRNGNFWESLALENRAWEFVRRTLDSPIPKLFQNGLYDMHFLWRRYGIPTRNAEHDTMLLHHALQPESEKGLGFLGSVYTNEASWKLMRTHTIKRDQ